MEKSDEPAKHFASDPPFTFPSQIHRSEFLQGDRSFHQNRRVQTAAGYRDYGFWHADASHMHARFMPHVFAFAGDLSPGTRVLDVGCGNGYTCGEFIKLGCNVVGLDLSEKGIAFARAAHPQGRFEVMAADSGILERLGEAPFDLVVSTEVVEHLYAPRENGREAASRLSVPAGNSSARRRITAI